MNTTERRVVTSINRMRALFERDYRCHGYTLISGNHKRGTFLVDYEEGFEMPDLSRMVLR